MYLKKMKNNKTERTYLSIAHGYRDKAKGYSTNKTIRKLGYLDELLKEYDDPIAHFEQVIQEMNQKQAESAQREVIEIKLNEQLSKDGVCRKNFGYVALSKVYHELELDKFFANRSRHLKVKYNVNNIMKLLVFSRLLEPGSKKRAYEQKERFFEQSDFTLDDVYRSLTHINKTKEALQLWIHNRIREQYGRDTELVYYDVTNYYFEIDQQDELRRRGVSKEHRPDPIIQMGLFMDNKGLPITYNLFPGNTNDCETLIPMLKELRREYELGRVIVVADKGLNTGRNCYYNTNDLRNGYVFSQTIRGGHKELKDYALDEKAYRHYDDDGNYKIKSRVYPREVTLESADGKEMKKRIEEKQVVFYSKDYDKKAKADRAAAVAKAHHLVNNPASYKQTTSYGAAKYVKNLEYDAKTGEILTSKHKPVFDEEKLREEEKFDGYYAIVTSECEKSDEEIIEIYRGLWRIEETFKVTKSELETRPVYVTREDHIQAHFLICFIALIIARIIQYRLNNRYSIARILETLNKIECSHIKENYYVFDHISEVSTAIGDALDIDFSNKFLSLKNIKLYLAAVKKRPISLHLPDIP